MFSSQYHTFYKKAKLFGIERKKNLTDKQYMANIV